MTTAEQLKTIAARVLPRLTPEAALEHPSFFIARVMATGNQEELKVVTEHYGKDALRGTVKNPPAKVFDRISWHWWNSQFGFETPAMPASFFAVYPWFKYRDLGIKLPKTSETLNRVWRETGQFGVAPVVAMHEEAEA